MLMRKKRQGMWNRKRVNRERMVDEGRVNQEELKRAG